MSARFSIEEVKQRLFNVHGDVVSLDEKTYKNTNTKCRFIDKDYGEFWNIPRHVIGRSQSHPKRRIQKIIKTKTMPVEEIKKRLFQVHGNIVSVDELTYKNTDTKCRFIDKEYGEWWAKPNHIICRKQSHPKRKIEKEKQTFLKHYGVDNPLKNKEIALKAARNSNNVYVLNHWKDNREIICQASYEKKVVESFNKNKENYEKNIPFTMPNGRVYFVDFYLPDRDLYIEVKGYKRPKNMAKWEWFHEMHPNSELWDKNRLKKLGIL